MAYDKTKLIVFDKNFIEEPNDMGVHTMNNINNIYSVTFLEKRQFQ